MMNKKTLLLVGAILAILVLPGCNKPVDVTAEISKANDAMIQAFLSGDVEALAMSYTENAKLFPTNSDIIEGRENIRAYWQSAVGMGISKLTLETVSAEAFGNTAIEEGRYSMYVTDDLLVDKGKYIVIWEKVDGRWLLAKDILNTSMPLPENTTLLSGSVIGIHTMKMTLKSNVTPEEFENFFLQEYIPEAEKAFPGIKFLLIMGDRGANKGKYGQIVYFKSLEDRNFWIPEPSKLSEKGKESLAKIKAIEDKLNSMVEFETPYTDWVIR